MSRFREFALAAGSLLVMLGSGSEASAQDAAAGEKIFARCKACHAVGEGAKNRVGPHLNGIVGRPAGAVEGYKYSTAMLERAGEGLVWDEANLAAYLADPRGFVKGTKMAFAGLKKDEDVANVIAYLAGFAEDGRAKAAEAPPPAGPAVTEQAAADGPFETPAAAPAKGGDGLRLGLGRRATAAEIAAWDIDIRPDGTGLPEGRGTVAEGMAVYDAQCASCHGDFGEAIGRWPVLAGGHGTLRNDRPEKTIGSYWPYLSTVYDYVRRAMPFGNARSLSDDEVYALTAYLLYLNDIVGDEEFELSKENFGSVRLPNEGNFVDDGRLAEDHYARAEEPCMRDCREGEARITMHAAVLDVTPDAARGDEPPAGAID